MTNNPTPTPFILMTALALAAGCAPPQDVDAPGAVGPEASTSPPTERHRSPTSSAPWRAVPSAEQTQDDDGVPPDEGGEPETGSLAQVPPIHLGDISLSDDGAVAAFCAAGFRSIQGSLRISGGVTDTTGVACLEHISGALHIDAANVLTAVEPFTALTYVGGSLRVANLPALDWEDPFPAVEFIGGDLSIEALSEATTIDGMAALRRVVGSVQLLDNASADVISIADGLETVGGEVAVIWNQRAAVVSSLESLQRVGGAVVVEGMTGLESVPALSSPDEVGGLEIVDNARLIDLADAFDIGWIGGDVRIQGNPSLGPDAIEKFVGAVTAIVDGDIFVGGNAASEE